MNQDNRVLGRVGARELTRNETEQVSAGIIVHTNTACLFTASGQIVGDINECGPGGL